MFTQVPIDCPQSDQDIVRLQISHSTNARRRGAKVIDWGYSSPLTKLRYMLPWVERSSWSLASRASAPRLLTKDKLPWGLIEPDKLPKDEQKTRRSEAV